MQRVARIEAAVDLEDPSDAVALARRHADDEQDEGFAQLVHDWETGRALVVTVDVAVVVSGDGDAPPRVERRANGIWIERDIPPQVETQIRDFVPGELASLAADLAGEGVEVRERELAHMFVHVELGEALRAELERDA